jgi:hypothetical protein
MSPPLDAGTVEVHVDVEGIRPAQCEILTIARDSGN